MLKKVLSRVRETLQRTPEDTAPALIRLGPCLGEGARLGALGVGGVVIGLFEHLHRLPSDIS